MIYHSQPPRDRQNDQGRQIGNTGDTAGSEVSLLFCVQEPTWDVEFQPTLWTGRTGGFTELLRGFMLTQRQRPGFAGMISTESLSPTSWRVLPVGYRYPVPPALLCPRAEVRKKCQIHRERRRDNDHSHNKGLWKALTPEFSTLSSLNYWWHSPGQRGWGFLREIAFGCGLEAHSLLLHTTCPSHLAPFPHVFLEEAGMHWKSRVLWKQPESLPCPGEHSGHRDTHKTQAQRRRPVAGGVQHMWEESSEHLILMTRKKKNLTWHLGGEKHWVQTSPWWRWVRVTTEQALWVESCQSICTRTGVLPK